MIISVTPRASKRFLSAYTLEEFRAGVKRCTLLASSFQRTQDLDRCLSPRGMKNNFAGKFDSVLWRLSRV
jgi:hypothetical protein